MIIPFTSLTRPQGTLKFSTSKNEIVLLKNDQGLIPFQNTQMTDIVSITCSKTGEKTFQNRIDSYKISKHYTTENNLQSVNSTEKTIFILLADTSRGPLIKSVELAKNSNSKIILITGKKKFANKLKFLNLCDAIVYTSKLDSASIDKAVQIIFGGRKANEKLSDTINSNFQEDFGLIINSKIKLGYFSPTDLGINEDKLNNGISAIINEALDSAAFPGCQILIAKDGNVFYHKSFGYHSYEKKRPVINSDIYDLASVTKTTAATLALMKLYDNQKLDLEAKFADYWPGFKKSNKKDITLRAVLAHHARLKPWIPYYKLSKKKNGKFKRKTVSTDSSRQFTYRLSSIYFLHNDFKKKKIYKWIKKSPLNEDSGYKYSGLSFYLFPEIVKNISGKTFETFLYKNFYQALDANTLGFVPTNRFSKNRIIPTELDDYFRMELLHATVHDEGAAMMKGISGNAGLFSNANDLAKVWQMLLNGGSYGGNQFLSKATIDEFTKCQYCTENNKRGLGFDKPLIEYDSIKSSVAKAASPNSFGHTGYTGTMVWADPDNGLLFIFLSNRVHPTRNNRKIYTMNIRPRIHNLVYELIL